MWWSQNCKSSALWAVTYLHDVNRSSGKLSERELYGRRVAGSYIKDVKHVLPATQHFKWCSGAFLNENKQCNKVETLLRKLLLRCKKMLSEDVLLSFTQISVQQNPCSVLTTAKSLYPVICLHICWSQKITTLPLWRHREQPVRVSNAGTITGSLTGFPRKKMAKCDC